MTGLPGKASLGTSLSFVIPIPATLRASEQWQISTEQQVAQVWATAGAQVPLPPQRQAIFSRGPTGLSGAHTGRDEAEIGTLPTEAGMLLSRPPPFPVS